MKQILQCQVFFCKNTHEMVLLLVWTAEFHQSGLAKGPGKTTYAFSVMFRLACYQQAGRVWSGGKGTENMLALAENVYVVLPTPFWPIERPLSVCPWKKLLCVHTGHVVLKVIDLHLTDCW